MKICPCEPRRKRIVQLRAEKNRGAPAGLVEERFGNRKRFLRWSSPHCWPSQFIRLAFRSIERNHQRRFPNIFFGHCPTPTCCLLEYLLPLLRLLPLRLLRTHHFRKIRFCSSSENTVLRNATDSVLYNQMRPLTEETYCLLLRARLRQRSTLCYRISRDTGCWRTMDSIRWWRGSVAYFSASWRILFRFKFWQEMVTRWFHISSSLQQDI